LKGQRKLQLDFMSFFFFFFSHRQPATAKWYDRRDSVIIEFCVADSKDVKVNFDKNREIIGKKGS